MLACSALLGVFSVFYPVLLIAVPAFIAACIAKSEASPRTVALFYSFPFLALILICGINESLLCTLPLLIMSIGSGILINILQKKRFSGFNTVFYTAILLGGMLYLSITMPGLLSGKGAFSAVRESAEHLNASFRQAIATLPEAKRAFLDSSLLSAGLDTFTDLIILSLVPCCCLIAGTLSFSNVLFFRLFIRKRRAELGFAPLRRFSLWSVPRSYVLGTGILLLGSFALDLMESEAADAVLLVSLTLFIYPLMIQGISLVDWFLLKGNGNILKKRLVVYILASLLFRFSFSILITLGTIEQFLRLRQRLVIINRPRGNNMHGPFRSGNSASGSSGKDTDSKENKTEEK